MNSAKAMSGVRLCSVLAVDVTPASAHSLRAACNLTSASLGLRMHRASPVQPQPAEMFMARRRTVARQTPLRRFVRRLAKQLKMARRRC